MSRVLTFLLVVVMGMSVLALPANASIDQHLSDNFEKAKRRRDLIDQIRQDEALQGVMNEQVRVIVQLSAPAEVDGGKASSISSRQKEVKDAISKIADVQFRRSYGYLINGFSMLIKRGDISKVRAVKGVASVQEADLFFPTMANAVEITKASSLWQTPYGLRGEGMVVSIIDTGIDPQHRDMRLSDSTAPRLTKQEIVAADVPGSYWSEKVPYGYNYADLITNFVDYSGSEHGMHVAGIVAANAKDPSEGVVGVAPEAQVLAMKVFSNYASGAWSDDIIMAIEDSVKLGADVINMSLGSPGGFSDFENGYSRAVRKATEAGCVVVIAAGNEGLSTSLGGITKNDYGKADSGIVGHPSTVRDALSVASVNNTAMTSVAATYSYVDTPGDSDPVKVDFPVIHHGTEPWTGDIELVDCGLGIPDDVPDGVSGKIALIKRGELSFADKIKNVTEKGAFGAIIYNSEGGMFGMAGVDNITIPAYSTENKYGEAMKALLDDGKALKIKISGEMSFPLSDSGKPSSFTSWGPTPELAFKPEVAAPGGQIYSTMNYDQYAYMSGTSMAAPHVAGGVALLAQQIGKTLKLTGTDLNQYVKLVLANTASPWADSDNIPYSPRQQGAGVVNLFAAVKTKVTASHLGAGNVELGDFTGVKTFSVTLKNYGEEATSFTINPGTVYTGTHVGTVQEVAAEGASLSSYTTSVTVPAGGESVVNFTLDPGSVINNYAEGFITFTSSNEDEQPSLSIPYMGFVGDWDSFEKIFDKPLDENGLSAYSTNGTYDQIAEQIASQLGDPIYGRYAQLLFGSTIMRSTERVGNKVEVAELGNFFDVIISEDDNSYDPSTVGFSPNDDEVRDIAYPTIGTFRGITNLRADILDAEGHHVRQLITDSEYRKPNGYYLSTLKRELTSLSNAAWDGQIYDPETGGYSLAPDGQYYYQVTASVRADGTAQSVKMPIKVDTKAPTFAKLDDGMPFVFFSSYTAFPVSASDEAGGTGLDTESVVAVIYGTDGISAINAICIPLSASAGEYLILVKDFENSIKGQLQSVELYAYDFAGNEAGPVKYAREEFIDTTYLNLKLGDRAVGGSIKINRAESEKLGLSLVATQSYIPLAALHSPNIKKLTIGGVPKDSEDICSLPITEGVETEYEIKAFEDAEGATEIVLPPSKQKVTIMWDKTLPTYEFTSAVNGLVFDDGINYFFVPDGSDSIALEGKATDNCPGVEMTMDGKKIDLDDDGNFSVTLGEDAIGYYHTMFLKDAVGNIESLVFGLLREGQGPDDMNPLPEPAAKPVLEVDDPYGDFLSGTIVINEKLDDDILKLSGKAENLLGLIIGTEDDDPLDISADGTWAVNLPLVQGVNYFYVLALDSDGYLVEGTDTKVRVFYDFEAPKLALMVDPTPDENDKIWTNQPQLDVKLSGTISDNTFGYQLAINGDQFLTSIDWDELGQNEKDFDYTVNAKAGDYILVELQDAEFGNKLNPAPLYQVLQDKAMPSLIITGPENNASVVEGGSWNYTWEATDADSGIKAVSAILNDEPYAAGTAITEPGTYTLVVVAEDKAGNKVTETRVFTILPLPVITVPSDTVVITAGEAFDPAEGVSAKDGEGNDITNDIVWAGAFDVNVPGEYDITYTVTDKNGVTATLTIKLIVKGKPILKGVSGLILIDQNQVFDPAKGVTAEDNEDGDLTKAIKIAGVVNTGIPGDYIITYTVTDSDGNTVSEQSTVRVVAVEAPKPPKPDDNPDPAVPVIEDVVLTDTKSGIKVVGSSGSLPLGQDGYELKVEMLNNHYKGYISKAYDVWLEDGKGNKVQPAGYVAVYMPIPADFSKAKLNVFLDVNNRLNKLNFKISGDSAVVKTNHFSVYVLTNPVSSGNQVPGTGEVNQLLWIGIVFMAAAAGLAVTLIFRRRRFKSESNPYHR